MKTIRAIIPLFAMLTSLGAVDFSASHAINSAYVFRGIVVNDETVYQPYVDASHESGVYAWFWGNMDLTNNGIYQSMEFSECDLGVGYSKSFEKLTVSAEFAEYFFPSVDGTNTRELFLRLNYDTVLSPTLTFINDIGEANGLYILASFSHNLVSKESLSVDASAEFGWANAGYLGYYFGANKSSLVDGNVGLSASFSLTESISISAAAKYMWLIGNDAFSAQAKSWYSHDNLLWGGITISHSF